MCAFERKHGKEVRAGERNVYVTVHHDAARVDVGDMKEMLVRAAGERDRQHLADARMGAAAPRDERSLARFYTTVRALQAGDDAIATLFERDQLCLALD